MATPRRNPRRQASQAGQQARLNAIAAKIRSDNQARKERLARQVITALSPGYGPAERKKRRERRARIQKKGGLLGMRAGPLARGGSFYRTMPSERNRFVAGYGLGHMRGDRARNNKTQKPINFATYINPRGALGRSVMANVVAMSDERNRRRALRQRRLARAHGGTSAQNFKNTTYEFRVPMTPREKLVKRIEKRIAQALANPNKPLKLRAPVPVQKAGQKGGTPYVVVSAPTYRANLLARYNRGKGAAQKARKQQKAYFRELTDMYKRYKTTRQPIPPRLMLAYKMMRQMKRTKALAKKKAKVNGGSSPVARRTRTGRAAGMARYKDLEKRQKAAEAKRRRRGVGPAA